MNVPQQSGYKDINSETQMPTVTEEQVKIYMDLYGQDLKENSKAMSIWLNSTATNPPIRQMYAPANVYAIANDHDYQDKSPEDMLQPSHMMNRNRLRSRLVDKEPTSSGGKN
ncbi:hypothetical protein LSH36_275g01063, partial [Paralvinella palmiformis]